MSYNTDRIYTVVGRGIVPRIGNVTVHESSLLQTELRDMGPLQVSHGLLPGDFAVFLSVKGPDSLPKTTGYLVTQVSSDTEGAGFIVGGNLVDRDPAPWVNHRIHSIWNEVRHTVDIGEEFGLQSLKQYLEQVDPSTLKS